MRQYPEMEISEQRVADQRRAIVTKGLLSRPWLEEIRVQVAVTLKEANANTGGETAQPIDVKEQKEESRSLENSQIAENLELDKMKTEFYEKL